MKNIFTIFLVIATLISCTQQKSQTTNLTTTEDLVYSYTPLGMDTTRSLLAKWLNKEVLAEKVVDEMESLENWSATYGRTDSAPKWELSTEQVYQGKTSIKIISSTKWESLLPYGGRMWDNFQLSRNYDGEDFSAYNRISVKVFPDCPGHRKMYLLIQHSNIGGAPSPDKYYREGVHTVMLENGKWNDVVFELPHLGRDKVTKTTFLYRLQGNMQDESDTVSFYFDHLAWQSVKPDHHEGWHTNNEIVFTHTGYNSDASKTAFTSYKGGQSFKLVSLPENEVLLEKDVLREVGAIGDFSVFDFSEIKDEGTYKLVYDEIESKPFNIKKDVWRETILKTINLFYCERCGYKIEGLHDECHRDWYTIYKGDTITLDGGWHDAGDLSQSSLNTADAVLAMFQLSEKLKNSDKQLSQRLKEEALWGLKWLHKVRLDDGEKVNWTTIDHWSDGIIGNLDDKIARPSFRTDHNFYYVLTDLEAAKIFMDENPELAQTCLANASEDWRISAKNTEDWRTDMFALAVWAGTKLYETTKDESVLEKTISFADQLMQLQQKTTMDWEIPLKGFFYRSKGSSDLFGYSHLAKVASPVTGLVTLCKMFPKHEKYNAWFETIRLYADFIKETAELTCPYYMIPANIYKVGGQYDAQVKNGIKLDCEHYLRMFPAWGAFRGNNAIIMSSAIALAQANTLINDPELDKICQSQLEWVVGKNPFNQSTMYGEGYHFAPQYSAMCGDITGGLPVGILSKDEKDLPYWQPAVWCNYKEIWVHPSTRLLTLVNELYY